MFADLTYLQDNLQLLIDADDSTPATTSDDYVTRTSYINRAIRRWERVEDTRWRELWTTLSASSPGSPDLTTVSGTSAYDAPSDFRFPAGFVKLTDSDGNVAYYDVVEQTENQLHQADGQRYAYFTGNIKDGYQVNIKPTPTVTGSTITYDYYKRATELSTGADLLEMSDPEFAINFAAALHYRNQRDLTRYSNFLADAEEALSGMQLTNQSQGEFQDDSMPDLSKIQGKGFGS